MDLWNEYEGRTIAGLFRLERLIRPEGRSAFFSTSVDNGTRTVIRLIESHYDDDQILARWQAATSLNQKNLLNLNKFGATTMDDTALVYAVLEPAQGALSDILTERLLTEAEVRELAQSIVPALQALHSIGLVHEHVQPGNILAVGETIKLRSDCIREAPEGLDGDRLRARDVHDLGEVLLQSLIRASNPTAQLPAPFHQIVQNALTNRWGLEEIAQHLAQPAAAALNPAPTTPYRRPPSDATPPAKPAASEPTPIQPEPLPTVSPQIIEPHHAEPHRSQPDRTYIPVEEPRPSSRRPIATIAALLLIVLCYFLWHLTHHPSTSEQAVAPAPIAQPQPTPQPTAPVAMKPMATASAPPANPNLSWRVVAFTYNHEGQAQAKADHLSHDHPNLHFSIFAPNGHAPWLVTVGGEMTRDQALSLQQKLRGRGLPRDLYARNYPASSR